MDDGKRRNNYRRLPKKKKKWRIKKTMLIENLEKEKVQTKTRKEEKKLNSGSRKLRKANHNVDRCFAFTPKTQEK